jgi:NRAMP (natural resistance-associated macrophage protein)-like metal ion transporter
MKEFISKYRRRLILFLAVFGPATITAMADNDASGVATYSIAGAKLGYPILFVLLIITVLLGITQEMGIRLALVTRKGLGDLIREHYGIKVSLFIFACLSVANMATIIVDLSAVKVTSTIFNIPPIPAVIGIIILSFIFVIKGNYKLNQNVMLLSCLFYFAYLFSAFKAKPDWGHALTNLVFPHGVTLTSEYVRDYIIIGLGVLGTTITPWGQFFISSFAFDKKIESARLKYSQFETYWGAFLTDFFSFFMIVATAATLNVNKIPILSGEQAALAIKPFAGEVAAYVFALGILNAGFMGIVIVSLTTAYAFAEFFGLSGSLDTSFTKSRVFYTIFIVQLIIAGFVVFLPNVSLFQLAVAAQGFNAMMLPFVFYYLLKLTNNPEIMGVHINKPFQRRFATVSVFVISIASVLTLILSVVK